MAGRPTKAGLDYVPFDTDMDQDKKIKLLESYHRDNGWKFWTKLLLRLYRERGYFYEASEENLLLLSDEIHVDKNSIDVYINTCVKLGLFSKEMFEKFRILTSKRIQITYLHAVVRRTRVYFFHDFLVLSPEEVLVYRLRLLFLIYDDINSIFEDNNIVSDYIKRASRVISYTILYKSIIINKGVENSEDDKLNAESRINLGNGRILTQVASKGNNVDKNVWWEQQKEKFKSDAEWVYRQHQNFDVQMDDLEKAFGQFFLWLELSNDQKEAAVMWKHFPNWYPKREFLMKELEKKQIAKSAGQGNESRDYQDKW